MKRRTLSSLFLTSVWSIGLVACSTAPVAAPAETFVAQAPTTVLPTTIPTVAATPLPPTATPVPTATPEPTAVPVVSRYQAHTVAEGETLEQLAELGGSTPELIRSYNLLEHEPTVGRPLLIPIVEGKQSQLPDEQILIERGPNERPWVALTIDAGAAPTGTQGILDALKAHNAHVTFFLTGYWVRDNPDLVRQMVADGHEIGNHSFNHPDMRKISEQDVIEELDLMEQALKEVVGEQASTRPFFRPPYGAYNGTLLDIVQRKGYLSVYWTLDSRDTIGEPKSADYIYERMTNVLSPEELRGAILLMHCGPATSAEALPRILDRYAELGLEVHTLSDVLGR